MDPFINSKPFATAPFTACPFCQQKLFKIKYSTDEKDCIEKCSICKQKFTQYYDNKPDATLRGFDFATESFKISVWIAFHATIDVRIDNRISEFTTPTAIDKYLYSIPFYEEFLTEMLDVQKINTKFKTLLLFI